MSTNEIIQYNDTQQNNSSIKIKTKIGARESQIIVADIQLIKEIQMTTFDEFNSKSLIWSNIAIRLNVISNQLDWPNSSTIIVNVIK